MENSNCKNLLIKSSENNIFFFKDKGWHFFTENQKFIHFSYKNFLINILLNVKIIFLQKYGVLETPNADYLTFYRKRGTNIIPFLKGEKPGKINFNLTSEHLDLYYDLMHTHYINECSDYSNYSVSFFFSFLIDFIKENKLEYLFPLDE